MCYYDLADGDTPLWRFPKLHKIFTLRKEGGVIMAKNYGEPIVKDDKTYRVFASKKTEFSAYEPDYYLAKSGNLAEYPAPKDCQAIIDSYAETVYQQILDQLLNQDVPSLNPAADYVDEREAYASDLDLLLQADSVIDDIKSNIADCKSMTKAQIINYLRNNAQKDYATYVAEREVNNNDETKKIISPDQPEKLPADGEASTQA